jgi:predicted dehydrogenase
MYRRTFLMAAAGAYAATGDAIHLGVIGAGGRGTFVMGVFQKNSGVDVAAICDVYEPNLERGISAAKRDGRAPRAYRNYRELLADKTVDAVLIATPEHWHYRMLLDALAAGKDVYVEKPLCQTPEQGVELVDAERNSKQIIQVGMQRRSYDLYLEARKKMAAGTLGRVHMVRSWWLNNYLDDRKSAPLDGKLDWEQWQGPAPKRPFDPDRFRNWRYYSDYAGGILVDQGAHVFDGIHMLMSAGYPESVTAAAGKPHRFDTPESVTACAEYPQDFMAVFTINYAAMKYKPHNDQLTQLDGDRARLDIGRENWNLYLRGAEETVADKMQSELGFSHATDLHVANFLECVRTRQRPTAPVALGFQAALVVQMANMSLKQGRRLRWNASARRVET